MSDSTEAVSPARDQRSASATHIAIGIIALGVVIRLSQAAFGRSLWTDESMLALSVGTRGFGELAQPLLFDQVAPLGFLWVTKALTLVGGMREWVLRLTPMLVGLLTLPAMWILARRLTGATAALGALTLTALSTALIYFSNEFKPYSLDVFLTILVIGLTLRALDHPERTDRWLALGLLGVLAVWFSAPAIFVLAGCGVVLCVSWARNKAGSRWRSILMLGACWVTAFVAAYAITYRLAAGGHYMRTFWQGSFLSVTSADGIANSWELIRRVIWGLLGGLIPYGRGWLGGEFTAELVFHSLALCVLGLSFLGLWALRREGNNFHALLLIAPVVMTVVANALGKYPLAPRLVVFLAPCLFIAAGRGIQVVVRQVGPQRRLCVIAAAALTIFGFPLHLRWHYGTGQWADSRGLVSQAVADGLPTYVFARGVPLMLFYTTDWQQPNVERLRRVHSVVGPGRFAFENRAGPVRPSQAQLDSLSMVVEKDFLLGLPEGMEFRYSRGWNRLGPDSGWARLEVSRIEALSSPSVSFLALHNIAAADRAVLISLRREGWACIAGNRSFGAYLATFERRPDARSQAGESDGCP